jgi:hypothetical protein
MSLGSYGKLATEVYDIDKPIGHSFGDVEFYLEGLSSCVGRILEPAVGSGRADPAARGRACRGRRGQLARVLAVCRARCAERGLEPVLHEADMRSLSLPNRYEAIIVPAGSFLLIERREESLGALRRFREHLVPGGRLILDLELQTELRVGSGSTRIWETPQGETIMQESKLVEVDFLEQYTVSNLRYEKWRDGELVKTELQRLPLRWYGLEEFELVLKSVGFINAVVSADYEHGERPSHADQTFTFEARRA